MSRGCISCLLGFDHQKRKTVKKKVSLNVPYVLCINGEFLRMSLYRVCFCGVLYFYVKCLCLHFCVGKVVRLYDFCVDNCVFVCAYSFACVLHV